MIDDAHRMGTKEDASLLWDVFVLRCAAVHCLVWGAFIILFPAASADVYGYAKPLTDLFLWQGAGLMILLLGIGYSIASLNPRQHWAVVLIGLIAKTLGPIGISWSVWNGEISSGVLLLIPFNDLLWLYPFAIIVLRGVRSDQTRGLGGQSV